MSQYLSSWNSKELAKAGIAPGSATAALPLDLHRSLQPNRYARKVVFLAGTEASLLDYCE
jgi:hypothetical protein